MAAIDRGIELSNWSDELRALLRRRICEGGGFALIALAAVIAVALARRTGQQRARSHAAVPAPGQRDQPPAQHLSLIHI